METPTYKMVSLCFLRMFLPFFCPMFPPMFAQPHLLSPGAGAAEHPQHLAAGAVESLGWHRGLPAVDGTPPAAGGAGPTGGWEPGGRGGLIFWLCHEQMRSGWNVYYSHYDDYYYSHYDDYCFVSNGFVIMISCVSIMIVDSRHHYWSYYSVNDYCDYWYCIIMIDD